MTDEKIEENEREIPEILCPLEREFPEETGGLTTCYATALALQKAREDGVRTAWDRAQVMKPCPIGSAGNCCNTCIMGPCRVAPGKEGRTAGICGASVETIAARNFAKMVAQGSASHSDHGRHVAEVFIRVARGEAPSYEIRDWPKLYAVAADLGVETDGREVNAIAEEVGQIVLAQFGQQEGELAFFRRAPQTRQKIWRKTGIASRGIDREIVETLSRVNMGMDQDYRSIMRQVSRCALSDGWGGSMIATELQDILLGTPIPTRGKANFGVLKEDYVNLVVHGHEPLLSDPLVTYTSTQEVKDLCAKVGAKGVNVVGVCCTANEVLMRHGVPLAGSFAQQELLLTTGVIDAMVVDIQCIMQSLPEIAEKYHTEIITTSGQAHIPGSTYIEFTEENAQDAIKEIVQRAVLNFKKRKSPAFIPDDSMDLIAGFSFETLKYIQGGSFRASFRPLNDNIINGRIRGVAAVVGCDSPQIREGARESEAHVALVRELIKNDVLVVVTGCSAITDAKQGLLLPEAMAWAGPGLREVCEALGIPPVLHAGSCVDNSRILIALTEMVKEGGLGEDISDLPAAGAAPDWINAKALAIGQYFVASGCLVVVRPELPIRGSEVFSKYLLEEYEDIYGGRWAMATTPKEMAEIMIAHIDSKRKALGIDKKRERILYDMAMRRELRV